MFGLIRYFSVASAVTLTAAAILQVYVYRNLAVEDLIRATEEQNVAVGRSIANNLWPNLSHQITANRTTDPDVLRAQAEKLNIGQSVQSVINGLHVLKVKIYNLDGLTIYSSQASQIGDVKVDNAPFLRSALDGEPASDISFRETFSSISGEVVDRHIVESYVPIRGANGEIEGVFELYADVTPTVQAVERRTNGLTAGLMVLFFLVYGALFLTVRHADGFIKRQYAELQDTVRQRELAEEKMDRAREQAEAASRAKTAFLANMSHELRTPLNAIMGFSEVIKEGSLGPVGNAKYVDYAADIHISAQHLLGLINDVLDLSRIEAGKPTLNEEAVDPGETIRSCLSMVKQEAQLKNVDLSIELPGGGPPLLADERLLKQIFINLLSNAVKFTREDGRVTVTRDISADGRQTFRVRDTGIGIAAEEIPKILEPFTQVETTLARQHQGSGLGLALAKKLVELHDGTLEIESEVGEGTVVTVRFPKERSSPARLPRRSAPVV